MRITIHIRQMLILILFSSYFLRLSAIDEMPIIAYMGVPYNQTTEENFKTFSECGFTVSLYIYGSLEQMKRACNIADKYGVKILGHCTETHQHPEKAAAVMKGCIGFFGYVLQDEPTADDIKRIQNETSRLKSADDTHCFYVNLNPYHDEGTLRHLKTRSYKEYLNMYSATSCQQISYDYYPVTTKGIRLNWYHNMEMVRKESLASGKPFWGFVLSTPHDVPFDKGNYYPTPTLAALRLQIYSNLAYGAQAIQYFTYWTPDGGEYHFHDGPIGVDGKKTKTYYLVQQMNQELKVIAKLFYGAKVLSVHHLGGELPKGTTRLTRMPINLSSLKVVSSKGAIISQLEKNGHRYLAIVNKNHEDTIKVLIKPLNDTPRHLTKALKEEPMKDFYSISAGDILLFRLK